MKLKNSKTRLGTKTDWERLSTMTDEEIDTSSSPELDDSFFSNAALKMPASKISVSLRIDPDVLDWYKKQGSGYQTRMNAVLRMYMQAKTGSGRRVPNKRNRARLSKSRKSVK